MTLIPGGWECSAVDMCLGSYALLTTVLYEHFNDMFSNLYLYFLCSFLKDIIVYFSFYSVCNTDASDVCAIKINYLLT